MLHLSPKSKRVVCLLLSLALLIPGFGAVKARAVSQAQIDELKEELKLLDEKAKEQQQVIDQLSENKSRVVDRKIALDGKIDPSRTYKPIGDANSRVDYAVFADGRDSAARCVCILAGVAFQEAKINYEEKHNRSIFIKNIISDNILQGDIYVRAKELHFEADVPRAVFLIRQTGRSDISALEVLSNMFPDRQKDFVPHVDCPGHADYIKNMITPVGYHI